MKARIDTIIAAIHIGDDLSPEEVTIMQNLIKEHADCFTLSMSEVHHVPCSEGQSFQYKGTRDRRKSEPPTKASSGRFIRTPHRPTEVACMPALW